MGNRNEIELFKSGILNNDYFVKTCEIKGLHPDEMLRLNDSGAFMLHDARLMFEAWKLRGAVPEGFVLVPRKPTPKMIDATWHHDDEIQEMSHNTRNEFIYTKMIEARDQPDAQ